jgi:CheY-like chemotaxis protein
MMPVMDGQQFRAEQLRDPELSQIPVLLISAYGDVEERASDLGRLPFLRKPFDLDQLLEQVQARCQTATSSTAEKTVGAASR